MFASGVKSKEEWKKMFDKVRVEKGVMDKLVMDFLVAEGYKEAAENFQLETRAEIIDLATIPDRMAVVKAVQSGSMEDAFEKINHLYPELLKTYPGLDFRLHQQHMIELIRNGKIQEALEVSQKKLALRVAKRPVRVEALKRTLVLLVFGNVPNSPVAELLDVLRPVKIAGRLNEDILKGQGFEIDTTLPFLLKLLTYAQSMLGYYTAYPQIEDLSTGALGDPMGN